MPLPAGGFTAGPGAALPSFVCGRISPPQNDPNGTSSNVEDSTLGQAVRTSTLVKNQSGVATKILLAPRRKPQSEHLAMRLECGKSGKLPRLMVMSERGKFSLPAILLQSAIA